MKGESMVYDERSQHEYPSPQELHIRIISPDLVPDISLPPDQEPWDLPILGSHHVEVDGDAQVLTPDEVFGLNAMLLKRGKPRTSLEIAALGARLDRSNFMRSLGTLATKLSSANGRRPVVLAGNAGRHRRYILDDRVRLLERFDPVLAAQEPRAVRWSAGALNRVHGNNLAASVSVDDVVSPESLTDMGTREKTIRAIVQQHHNDPNKAKAIAVDLARVMKTHQPGPAEAANEFEMVRWSSRQFDYFEDEAAEQLLFAAIDKGVAVYTALAGEAPAAGSEEERALYDLAYAYDRIYGASLRLVHLYLKTPGTDHRPLPYGDMFIEGVTGLSTAICKFEPSRGTRFNTYAKWWIRQAITRAIADQSRHIRLPVAKHDTWLSIKKAQSSLTHELGRPPSAEEIAKNLDVEPQMVDLLLVRGDFEMPFLDQPVNPGEPTTLKDVLSETVDASDSCDFSEQVVGALTVKETVRFLVDKLPIRYKGTKEMLQCVLTLSNGLAPDTFEDCTITTSRGELRLSALVAEAQQKYHGDVLTDKEVAQLIGIGTNAVNAMQNKWLPMMQQVAKDFNLVA